ncbi:hypothetical protein ACFX1Q_025201 [Malus domestica]
MRADRRRGIRGSEGDDGAGDGEVGVSGVGGSMLGVGSSGREGGDESGDKVGRSIVGMGSEGAGVGSSWGTGKTGVGWAGSGGKLARGKRCSWKMISREVKMRLLSRS